MLSLADITMPAHVRKSNSFSQAHFSRRARGPFATDIRTEPAAQGRCGNDICTRTSSNSTQKDQLAAVAQHRPTHTCTSLSGLYVAASILERRHTKHFQAPQGSSCLNSAKVIHQGSHFSTDLSPSLQQVQLQHLSLRTEIIFKWLARTKRHCDDPLGCHCAARETTVCSKWMAQHWDWEQGKKIVVEMGRKAATLSKATRKSAQRALSDKHLSLVFVNALKRRAVSHTHHGVTNL